MAQCPCNNAQGKRWHQNRRLPQCGHIRRLRSNDEIKYVRKSRVASVVNARTNSVVWNPGTAIYVPEVDPL